MSLFCFTPNTTIPQVSIPWILYVPILFLTASPVSTVADEPSDNPERKAVHSLLLAVRDGLLETYPKARKLRHIREQTGRSNILKKQFTTLRSRMKKQMNRISTARRQVKTSSTSTSPSSVHSALKLARRTKQYFEQLASSFLQTDQTSSRKPQLEQTLRTRIENGTAPPRLLRMYILNRLMKLFRRINHSPQEKQLQTFQNAALRSMKEVMNVWIKLVLSESSSRTGKQMESRLYSLVRESRTIKNQLNRLLWLYRGREPYLSSREKQQYRTGKRIKSHLQLVIDCAGGASDNKGGLKTFRNRIPRKMNVVVKTYFLDQLRELIKQYVSVLRAAKRKHVSKRFQQTNDTSGTTKAGSSSGSHQLPPPAFGIDLRRFQEAISVVERVSSNPSSRLQKTVSILRQVRRMQSQLASLRKNWNRRSGKKSESGGRSVQHTSNRESSLYRPIQKAMSTLREIRDKLKRDEKQIK